MLLRGQYVSHSINTVSFNANSNRLSLCLGEKEPMEYTTYTDDCCRRIQEAAECETDPYLLQLVRIAHMGEKIYRAVQYHEKDTPTGLAPKAMAIRWLEKEIQQLKDSYSGEFTQSCTSPN